MTCATIADFEKMAYTKVPPPKKGEPPINLVSFFSQWVNSTGIPEFKLEFIVYRTRKGFKVVGRIHQDLDTFRMPVELRVDTEGNPEYKKILEHVSPIAPGQTVLVRPWPTP